MKYCIKHQTDGQIHIILPCRRLTDTEADVLYYGSLRDYTVNFNKAIVRPAVWIDLTSDLF